MRLDTQSIAIMAVSGVVLLLCLILFICMIVKKSKNKKKSDDNLKQPSVEREVEKLLPIRFYDTENECFVRENGTILDMLKINTKDLLNASEAEKNWDNMKFSKLYRTYSGDLKIVALNFPCNTSVQQEYWRNKLSKTANPVLKEMQRERLFQLEWLEKNSTTREFYLFYFSKDIEEHVKNRLSILSILATGVDGVVEEMSKEKKIQILYKMNNKSSYVYQK